MISYKHFKITFLIFASLPFLCFGQSERREGYSAISSRKPVTDYFDSVGDKSFYQRQRIHGMKKEINNYSERLHTLQSRFDEIFYGLSRSNDFSKPFNTDMPPMRPSDQSLFDDNYSSTPTTPRYDRSSSDLFEPPPQNSRNQLAFQVDGPIKYSEDGKTKALFNPKAHGRSGLGKYFLLTPGYAIPYKIHRPSSPFPEHDRYKRYDPGVSVILSGGLEISDFRIGLGGMFKRNMHHESSYERHPSLLPPLHRDYFRKTAETYAGFLDLSYSTNFVGNLGGYFGAGIAYYLPVLEDPRKRVDHGIFATGNLGLSYNFNEMVALRLGYRYLHEDEVPAHVAELGLDFEF